MTTSSNNLRPDINFLFEIGNLRLIPRMGNRFLRGVNQNLAEHHFRVFWIAMIIAGREGGDTGKIAKMVLMHDIPESRTGDVDYLSRQYVERNEKLALEDMLSGLPMKDEFETLWHEYEAHETLEAKIAKDADNLDVDFDLFEQAAMGNTLRGHWQEARRFIAKEKFYTKTAKKLFAQLENANPHEWHLNGRNRLTNGDWKK
ncbi:MAG TPA: HD domain-containing protein [Candidatus Saccharimonadales bacterium]|nr:HD domain-containing protein [Candidatus Saccharimonadales bacterium]